MPEERSFEIVDCRVGRLNLVECVHCQTTVTTHGPNTNHCWKESRSPKISGRMKLSKLHSSPRLFYEQS
jgi:hypothetical protein